MILACSIRLLLMLPLLGRIAAETRSTSVETFVDGAKEPLTSSNIKVANDTSTLRFFVKPKAARARYKLSSLDSEWQEKIDGMLFIIRFVKINGDPISQNAFPAVGTSSGWRGSLEKSHFTHRRETVLVPKDAANCYVVISSAGPPGLVGVFAVSGISIQSKPQGTEPSITYLHDSRRPDSDKKIWVKSGTHSTMARALHLDEKDSESPVLIINDDDLTAHADWNIGIKSLQPVVAGQQLDIQWKELYNSGIGGPFSAEYERPPSGVHYFEVEDLSVTGQPLGLITRVEVTVARPFWQRFGFWAPCLVIIAIVSTLGGRYLIKRRVSLHLEEAQKISDERLRIARDLHDDLGTRLSHISLLSSFSQRSSPNPEVSSNFAQITAMSRELIGVLSETVWMLNPKNNQLESLVDFLCRLLSELCRLAVIRCRIDALSVTENVPITHEFRHNIILAFKEIVNNSLKHSNGTEISMTIRVEGKMLFITIADNGIGLTPEVVKPGVGLASIKQRLTNIRGKCYFDNKNDGECGLIVSLQAPLS